MKRRDFIEIAAAGAAGLAGGSTMFGAESDVAALARPQLLDILRDEDLVCDLGRRYRETVPAEDNADVLAHAIVGGSAAMPQASLCARIAEQVRRDFAHGRTVTLNGWVLAATEARQCALLSLSPA